MRDDFPGRRLFRAIDSAVPRDRADDRHAAGGSNAGGLDSRFYSSRDPHFDLSLHGDGSARKRAGVSGHGDRSGGRDRHMGRQWSSRRQCNRRIDPQFADRPGQHDVLGSANHAAGRRGNRARAQQCRPGRIRKRNRQVHGVYLHNNYTRDRNSCRIPHTNFFRAGQQHAQSKRDLGGQRAPGRKFRDRADLRGWVRPVPAGVDH